MNIYVFGERNCAVVVAQSERKARQVYREHFPYANQDGSFGWNGDQPKVYPAPALMTTTWPPFVYPHKKGKQ